MPFELVAIFTKEEIEQLLNEAPDQVVVRLTVSLSGSTPQLDAVSAEGRKRGAANPLVVAEGCPSPPCSVLE